MHYCSSTCAHLVANSDGGYSCPFSGLVFGVVCERVEGCTGRRIWSSDPDAKSGAPPGGWRRKKNAYAESKKAWSEGHAYAYLNDAQEGGQDAARRTEGGPSRCVPLTSSRGGIRKRSTKRVAECVRVRGAVSTDAGAGRLLTAPPPPESESPATARAASGMRKDAALHEIQNVLKTLVGTKRKQRPTGESAVQVNEKLLNGDALYISAVRKYVRAQLAAHRQPALDDLHNISLAVAKVVASEKAKLEAVLASAGHDLVHDYRFTALAHTLLHELWAACCRTPAMQGAHVGHETVKTCMAGAIYAFKRGLALRGGVVLIPSVAEFEVVLPRSRAEAKNTDAKALHASSHRGMQAIHRCLASDTPDRIARTFRPAANAAEALHRYVQAYQLQ